MLSIMYKDKDYFCMLMLVDTLLVCISTVSKESYNFTVFKSYICK